MFVNIWSIAVFSAAVFFILTLICKGIAGRIMNVILLSLSVFLTIYSLVLGVCRPEAGGYVFTKIASIGDPTLLPYFYPIVFFTYTVISIGMLSMKYAPQKNAADTGENSSRRKKYVLSYVSGYTVAALMSVAVIILFVGENTIEKRTARIMEKGDGYYYEDQYVAALSIYQAAFRLNPDDPDVYIAMLKASGKCLNPDEILSSYEMAVENLGRKDLKNITEKAWKLIGDLEDDFRDAGRDEDYRTLVNNFRYKVDATDIEIDLSRNRPRGYTTHHSSLPPV
jgi:tetratricopeptide (TPR) repeat protein